MPGRVTQEADLTIKCVFPRSVATGRPVDSDRFPACQARDSSQRRSLNRDSQRGDEGNPSLPRSESL